MNLRWNFHRKDEDTPNSGKKDANAENNENDAMNPVSTKGFLEREMSAMMNDEIRDAAQELVETQRKEIRLVVEACKQVIADVVKEEKKLINERKETIRKLIVSSDQF
jgi:hypothetical protein